jgi:hypothetical protein
VRQARQLLVAGQPGFDRREDDTRVEAGACGARMDAVRPRARGPGQPPREGAQHRNELWRVEDLEVGALDRDFWSAPSRCTVMKNLLSAVPGYRSAR